MSEIQSFGLTLLALCGGFALEWALAAFELHSEQADQIKALTPTDGGDQRAIVATAFREVWEGARDMWVQGTSGCHSGSDAEHWFPVYDAWVQAAKERIERDAGPDERTAVFEIGSMHDIEQIRGQSAEHSRRLTCLKHHMDQLKDGLRRYLPSERR